LSEIIEYVDTIFIDSNREVTVVLLALQMLRGTMMITHPGIAETTVPALNRSEELHTLRKNQIQNC